MLAYTVTRDAINVVVDGCTASMPRDAGHADLLLAELAKEDTSPEGIQRVKDLLDGKKAIVAYSDGDAEFMVDGTIRYKGEKLPPVLAQKITDCMKDGVPYMNLLNFFDRLKANPSQRAIAELYSFLEHRKMPITPEGHFVAYKGVTEDYWSLTGNRDTKVLQGKTDSAGHILNRVGEVIEVQRNHVDDDANRGCSSGLHAGSIEYASGFGPKVVIVDIDPADVVSIPYDCCCQKLRACKYKVVADFVEELTNGGVDAKYQPYGGLPVYEFGESDFDVAVDLGDEDDGDEESNSWFDSFMG